MVLGMGIKNKAFLEQDPGWIAGPFYRKNLTLIELCIVQRKSYN